MAAPLHAVNSVTLGPISSRSSETCVMYNIIRPCHPLTRLCRYYRSSILLHHHPKSNMGALHSEPWRDCLHAFEHIYIFVSAQQHHRQQQYFQSVLSSILVAFNLWPKQNGVSRTHTHTHWYTYLHVLNCVLNSFTFSSGWFSPHDCVSAPEHYL